MDHNTTEQPRVTELVEPSVEHKALFREIYEAIIAEAGKHPSFGATDVLMVLGSVAGAIIGTGYTAGHDIIKRAVVQNMDLAIGNFALLSAEPAGNA